jgi:glycosyltransferase involved in cell wall biosynthesis
MNLLTIVIPAYNEGAYILKTLQRIQKSVTTPFECTVVVDHSDDTTIAFVKDFSQVDSRFSFQINEIQPGPAGAIRQGIKSAKGEVVAIVSGDGSDDVSQIDSLTSLVERGVSIAVASRYMKGGQLVGAPFLKSNLSRIAGLTLYHFARIGTRDATNNFKVYSREFLNSLEIQSMHGFEIGLELTTKARIQKRRIAEIPTIWIERTENESNFPLLKSIPKYLRWFALAMFGTLKFKRH